MARLPSFGETSRSDRISVDVGRVATPSMQGAGAEWEAKAQIAKGLGEFTSSLILKREESNSRNTAADVIQKYKLEYDAVETEAKLKFGGDHKGYSDYIGTKLTDIQDRLTKDMNGQSKSYFDDAAKPFSTNAQIKANGYENLQREKYFLNSKSKIIDEDSATLYSKPDPINANNSYNDYKNLHIKPIVGISINESAALKLQETYKNKARFATVQGLLDQDHLDVAEDFVNGNIKYSNDILEGMDANEKNKYMDAIKAKKKTRSQEDILNSLNQLEDAKAAAASGNNNPEVKKSISALETNLNSIQTDDPSAQRRIADAKVELKVAKKVGDYTNSIKYMPTSQLKRGEDIFKTSKLEEASENEQAIRMYDSEVNSILRERENDGFNYVAKYFPNIKTNEEIIRKQQALGITNIRAISNEESARLGSIFNSANGEIKNALLEEQVFKKYGSNANLAIRNLVEDKSISKEYAVAAQFESGPGRAIILRNVKDKEVINESFKDVVGSENFFRNSVALTIKDYTDPFFANRDEVFARSIQDSIMTEAKRRMLGEEKNSVKAIKDSADAIMGSIYTPVKNGRNKVIIHKKFNVDPTIVETYFDNYHAKPSELGIDFKSIPAMKSENDLAKYLKNNSRWIMNQQQDGMILQDLRPDGTYSDIVIKGKPITKKFKDIK
jgi:hypothetical protein